MRVIDEQHILNVMGQDIQFPKRLSTFMYECYLDYTDKFDNPILITGAVGSAKSSMAKLIGAVWQHILGKEIGLYNFTWITEGLINFTDEQGNEGELIVWDEAIQGGTGRDSITKIGNKLKITLVTKRRKKHFYILIVDDLKEFSDKIIKRAKLLIDMRVLRDGFRKRRGYFKIYTPQELQDIYYLLKNRSIKNIDQYFGKDKNFYRFYFKEDVVLDEAAYEEKKIQETMIQENNTEEVTVNKNHLEVYKRNKAGESMLSLSKEFGKSKTTIHEWITKVRSLGLN